MAHDAGRPRDDMTAVVDSVASLRDAVLDASHARRALRIAGRGSWLDAGRPVHASETLSVRGLTGITEYVPGDLTLTASAGTTLGEIRAATAPHGQWLALDPFGDDDGTIGATVATGAAGPLVTSFGRPRDLVLGLEFVTGTGVVARGGGRVVKNVAGFDLTRLLTGSWGTLGIITEVTLRLHARPEADESIAISLDERPTAAAERTRQLLRRLPFVPYVCEVVNDALARHLAVGTGTTMLARLGGNRESVRAQRAAFNELGDARDVDPNVWPALRACEPAAANVVRVSRVSSEISSTWSEAQSIGDTVGAGTAFVHATPSRGVVRCILPRGDGVSRTRLADALSAPTTVTRVGERLEPALWSFVTRPSPSDELASRVRAAFDPHAILNPGMLGAA